MDRYPFCHLTFPACVIRGLPVLLQPPVTLRLPLGKELSRRTITGRAAYFAGISWKRNPSKDRELLRAPLTPSLFRWEGVPRDPEKGPGILAGPGPPLKECADPDTLLSACADAV